MRNSLWIAVAVIAVAAVAIVYMLTKSSTPPPQGGQTTQTAGGQTAGGQTGAGGGGQGQQQGINVKPGEWKLVCPQPDAAGATPATDETAGTTESGTESATGQEPPKPSKCLINYQVATAGEDSKVIAGVNVRLFGPQKQPVLIVRLPPAAKAGNEVVFVIDENQPFKAALKPENCNDKACIVRAGLPQAVVDQLKAGKAMAIVFYAKADQRARAPVALATFNAAFAQLLAAE